MPLLHAHPTTMSPVSVTTCVLQRLPFLIVQWHHNGLHIASAIYTAIASRHCATQTANKQFSTHCHSHPALSESLSLSALSLAYAGLPLQRRRVCGCLPEQPGRAGSGRPKNAAAAAKQAGRSRRCGGGRLRAEEAGGRRRRRRGRGWGRPERQEW